MKTSRLSWCFAGSIVGHSLAFMAVALAPGRDAPPAEERVDRPLTITLVVEGDLDPIPIIKQSPKVVAPVPPPAPTTPAEPHAARPAEPVVAAPVVVAEATAATPVVPAAPPTTRPLGPFPAGGSALVASAPTTSDQPLEANTNAQPSLGLTGVKAVPKYGNNPEVPYPAQAKRRHQQGLVVLAVTVSERGRAANVRIKESSGFPILDEAALAAVKNWSFEPAQVNSLPVASEIEVPVRFSLRP